jgi:hypothetical protein
MAYADPVTHTLNTPAVIHLVSGDEVGAGDAWLAIERSTGVEKGGDASGSEPPNATVCLRQRHLTCIDVGVLPN